MQLLQYAVVEVVDGVPQLIRIRQDVVEGYEAGDEFAIEEIVSGVDRPSAPIRVVVRVGTRAKGSQRPEGRNLPMVIVLFETIHVGDITFVMLVFAQFFLLLFRPFSAVVGILSVEHGQILISNVVPTEIPILPAEIRRLNGGQHVEQILLRPAE